LQQHFSGFLGIYKITNEIRKGSEMNQNKNTIYPNLWNIAEEILKEKCVLLNDNI